MVLIDRKGEVLSRVVSDLPIGCGIKYALRMIKESNDEIADAFDKKEVTDPIGDDDIEEGELKLANIDCIGKP